MNLSIDAFPRVVPTALFFLLFSCKELKKIGSEIQPQNNQVNVALVDTFGVELSTVYYKDINTRVSELTLFGKYNDAQIGEFDVEGYTELDNVLTNLSFEQGAVYDSLVLYLNGFPYHYGDTTQLFELEVYRLAQAIDTSAKYTTSSSIPLESSPIGTLSFFPKVLKRDTLKIRLSNELGNEIFSKSGQEELSNHYNFNRFLRGLCFKAKNANCVLGIQNSNASGVTDRAFVRIFYHITENGNMVKRWKSFNFSDRNIRFNSIKTQFKAPLNNLVKHKDTLSSVNSNNLTYVQNSSALYTSIQFSGLSELQKLSKSILINKAEIWVKVDTSLFYSNNVKLTPPNLLAYFSTNDFSFVRNSDSTIKYLGIETQSGFFGPSSPFNKSTQSYSIDATDYIQKLVYGKEKESRFLLVPTSYATTLDRLILSQPSSKNENIKLRVYYTRF